MRKGRSTCKPTKREAERFALMRDFGCILCDMLGIGRAGEIHHLTVGGKHGQKRRGHRFTICACEYHHRGVDWSDGTLNLGPSYALQPRAFRERFGSDDELLALQDELIGWKDGTDTTLA